MAKELLVASMHFREDLTLQQEAQDTTGLQQSSATTVPDIKTPLDNFLNAFDTRFTNRKELSVDEWLGSFYALCVISIVKTILIDTSSPAKHPKSGVYAAQLTTIYKVLVSVFSWSAKVNKWCQKENELRDPLMRNWASNGNLHVGELVSAQLQSALKDTKKLVRQSQWSGAGIKHTKDFLLSLGTGKFADKGFNGFSVQVIQHKSFEKAAHNTPRMVVGTPQLTPLQPKRQQSPEHAGIGEYQPPLSERMNYIRPAPVAEPTPDSDWANRSNPGLRRSNMAEVPRLSYAQRTGLERTPMGPPGRDVFSATRDGELPANWKSAPKSYTGRIPGAPTEAHEDVQYWNSPASSTFTPIRKAYDDNDGSYQRAKFQRRENEYYEAQMRHAEYRTANGNREEAKREEPLAGDEYRRNSFIAPRKEPRLPLPYSGTENERPQAQMGQGSYYAPPGPPINREPSAKRRHSQFSLGNDQPAPEAEQTPSTFSSVQRPIAPVNPRNETSASTTNTNVIGGLAGTAVFGLNNSMLEKSKPKRRELSKEQREQAAVVRRLGACPECKAKKVKCDPSHEGPRRIGACDACKKAKVKCQPSHFSDLDPRLHIPPNSGQTSMSPINGEEPPKKKKK